MRDGFFLSFLLLCSWTASRAEYMVRKVKEASLWGAECCGSYGRCFIFVSVWGISVKSKQFSRTHVLLN